jgi:hypothetical protein
VFRYSATAATLTLSSVSYRSRDCSSGKRHPEPEALTIGLSRGVGFFEGQTILLFAKKIVKLVSHARAQYAMTFTSN